MVGFYFVAIVPATSHTKSNQFEFMKHVAGTNFCPCNTENM